MKRQQGVFSGSRKNLNPSNHIAPDRWSALLPCRPCPGLNQRAPAVALPTSHNPGYDLRTCRIWQAQRISGGRKLSMNPHSSGTSSHGELRNRGCAARKSVRQIPPLKSSQRMDQSKTGAVRTHVVMLTPMHRSCDSTPLTVTFDTNTLASVVAPETAQRGTGESGAIVAAAMRAGRIRGFFSETVITLEGIKNVDRADVLGRTRMVSDASSTGTNNITLTVGVRHARNPLAPRSSATNPGGTEARHAILTNGCPNRRISSEGPRLRALRAGWGNIRTRPLHGQGKRADN